MNIFSSVAWQLFSNNRYNAHHNGTFMIETATYQRLLCCKYNPTWPKFKKNMTLDSTCLMQAI